MKRFQSVTVLVAVVLTTVSALSAEPQRMMKLADSLTGEKGEYLIGPVTQLQWEAFEPTIIDEMRAYQPSPDLVTVLAEGSDGISIICVLGSWCGDSRREVPRFWQLQNLMSDAAIPLEMIAVGRTDAPEAMVWEAEHEIVPDYRSRYDVTFVPTFIVYDGDMEIGRIIETPEVSLEADLARILDLTPSPITH